MQLLPLRPEEFLPDFARPITLFLLPIPIKIKYLVIVYFLVDLFAGINPQPGDNVAHIAHVGGALIGLILVITMNRSNRRTFY